MRWFKHLSSASDDPFLVDLEERFGLEGYARWWKLLEAVASQVNPKEGRWTVSYPWAKWQQILQGKRKKIELFLSYLVKADRISIGDSRNIPGTFPEHSRNVSGFSEVSSWNILEIGICNLQKYIDEYSRKSGATPERLRTKDTDTEAETEKGKKSVSLRDTTPERSGDHSGEEPVPVPVEPPVISLPLNDGSEHHVSKEQAAEYAALFPAVDVSQALRSMRAWLDSNPTNRKTPRGVRRFITGWLDREQNRARPSPQAPAIYGGMRVQTVRDGQTVARDQMAKAVLAQRAKEQGLNNANRANGADAGRGVDHPGGAVHALPE